MSAAESLPEFYGPGYAPDLYGPFAQGLFSVLKPHPVLQVSEWAERYRTLPQGGAAASGPWRNDQTPYLVEIMDALSSSSRAIEVVFCKGAQIGGTEAGTNWLMYLIDQEPGPIFALQPTVDNAIEWSKQRLGPSLEQCERTRRHLRPAKSRASGNTIAVKEFLNGAYLFLSGANSPNPLASKPIGYLYFDEVDRYPDETGKEGDPIDLAIQRMNTFPRGKAFFTSTPTLMGKSKIWDKYQDSDQRVYEVPCPFCGHYQEITFDRLFWEKGDYSDVCLTCVGCGCLIPELHKPQMLAAGKWIPRNPGHWRVGFHLSGLYSPLGWKSWGRIAREYEEAEGDVGKMTVFVNTVLGLPWEEDAEVIAEDYLKRRVETYDAEVPMGVLALTLAVDVQGDRLECEVVGWGKDEESWGIEYRIFEGDPTLLTTGDPNHPSVWERLTEYREKQFRHADGKPIGIRRVMIDSGGSCTDIVYQYCHQHWRKGVSPVKGGSLAYKPLLSRPTKHGKGESFVWLYSLGVNKGKDLVFSRLKIETTGPGYCHFPDDPERGYDGHYYAGLIAEKKKKVRKNGVDVVVWELPNGARNEPFDIRVYNTAAIRSLRLDWDKMREAREHLPAIGGIAMPQPAAKPPVVATPSMVAVQPSAVRPASIPHPPRPPQNSLLRHRYGGRR